MKQVEAHYAGSTGVEEEEATIMMSSPWITIYCEVATAAQQREVNKGVRGRETGGNVVRWWPAGPVRGHLFLFKVDMTRLIAAKLTGTPGAISRSADSAHFSSSRVSVQSG